MLLGGAWFVFCGSFALLSTRIPELQWMWRLPRTGTHPGEKRVSFVILGVLFIGVGTVQLVRAFMLR
jgi:hypothetical protein